MKMANVVGSNYVYIWEQIFSRTKRIKLVLKEKRIFAKIRGFQHQNSDPNFFINYQCLNETQIRISRYKNEFETFFF